MAVGVASLIQSFKGRHYALPTGKEGRWAEFRPLSDVLSTRFVLFRVKGGLGPLTLCHDYAAKVEATFRMAFKGGLTMFARQGEELCIRSLHFDGYKHYKRRLDLHRILRKIGTPPRGVHLHREIVLGDGTSDHRDRDAQPYADCQLLQLTDPSCEWLQDSPRTVNQRCPKAGLCPTSGIGIEMGSRIGWLQEQPMVQGLLHQRRMY
jgi:hypothetical protein